MRIGWAVVAIAIAGLIVLHMTDYLTLKLSIQFHQMTVATLDDVYSGLARVAMSGVIGVIGGRVLRNRWYLASLAPIVWAASVFLLVLRVDVLYIALFPLMLIICLTAAYVGSNLAESTRGGKDNGAQN